MVTQYLMWKLGFDWLIILLVFMREREREETPLSSPACSCVSWSFRKTKWQREPLGFFFKANDVLECGVQSAQCWGAACRASPYPAQWLRSLNSVLKCPCFLAPVLPEDRLCVSCYLTKEGLHWPLLEKTKGSWVLVSLTFKRAQRSKNAMPESRTHCELGSWV